MSCLVCGEKAAGTFTLGADSIIVDLCHRCARLQGSRLASSLPWSSQRLMLLILRGHPEVESPENFLDWFKNDHLTLKPEYTHLVPGFKPADAKVYLKPTPEALKHLRQSYPSYWETIRADDVFEQTDVLLGCSDRMVVGVRCLRTGNDMGGRGAWFQESFVEMPKSWSVDFSAPSGAVKPASQSTPVIKPAQPKVDAYAAYQAVTLICNLDKLLDQQVEVARQELDRPMRPRYPRLLGTGDSNTL